MKMTCQKSMTKRFLMKKPWLGAVRAFEEFKLSIYGDNDDEESAIGNGKANDAAKKKKPVAENAAKESANYNWPDLTDNGHDTGVSPLYRAVKGLKLLGTKSASIVP
ncbi:ATP-dependent DNA helicase 2 subunit KU70-like isoform X1 [Populus alba]|uniref:ATP-dependent DNA helicase 2 subunit KU70-like isoform X1 n=1 Tax=Populus alba TaxID=43335 RepID=UPI003CC7595A